jgi:large subunit ribosomal protein L35
MPKLKTKKGAAKRFRLTKSGKVKYTSCGKSHLLSSKKTKRIRHLRRGTILEGKKQAKYLKRILPYG